MKTTDAKSTLLFPAILALFLAPRSLAGDGTTKIGLSGTLERLDAGAGKGRDKIDAEKAWLSVPRQWDAPEGPRFRLQLLRLKSTNGNPGPPIVYPAGGPGRSGTRSVLGDRYPLFERLRQLADVIAIDQRGVLSEPFPVCRTPYSLPLSEAFDQARFTNRLEAASRACVATWAAQGVDVADLDTRQSAHDLEALRAPWARRPCAYWESATGRTSVSPRSGSIRRPFRWRCSRALRGPDHTLKSPKVPVGQADLDRLLQRVRACKRRHSPPAAEVRGLSAGTFDARMSSNA